MPVATIGTVACLIVAAIYVIVWPSEQADGLASAHRFVPRWVHPAVWVVLAVACLLFGIRAPVGTTGRVAAIDGLLYIVFFLAVALAWPPSSAEDSRPEPVQSRGCAAPMLLTGPTRPLDASRHEAHDRAASLPRSDTDGPHPLDHFVIVYWVGPYRLPAARRDVIQALGIISATYGESERHDTRR